MLAIKQHAFLNVSSLTFLNRQNLTWVDLHFHPAISLIFVKPSVTREHVLPSLYWNRDLDTGQEPATPKTHIIMSNQYSVDLWKKTNKKQKGRKNPQHNRIYLIYIKKPCPWHPVLPLCSCTQSIYVFHYKLTKLFTCQYVRQSASVTVCTKCISQYPV